MNEISESGLVQLLFAYEALTSLVINRVSWDDSEIDVPYPAIRLRTIATQLPARELRGRGGMRRCLVAMDCDDDHSTGCSRVADAAIAALEIGEAGPFSVTVQGTEVRFGGITLEDVTQSRTPSGRAYRKTVLLAVWFYE